jgi:hypothetical protein
MLAFAVLASTRGHPLSLSIQDRVASAGAGDLDEAQVFPVAERFVWFDQSRSLAVLGWWSEHDPFGAGPPFHIDDESITAFSGHVWPRGVGWRQGTDWARQLGEFATRPGFPASVEALGGVFTAVHARHDGSACVFADPFGLGLIYTADTEGTRIYSSRALVAAALATADGSRPVRDAQAVAWLAFSGVIVDDSTGFVGVRTLELGARVEITPDRPDRVVVAAHPALRHADGGLSVDEALSIAADDLVAEVAIMAGLDGLTRTADLTGGKDSRTILAAATIAGVADRFQYWTTGPPTIPDQIVAGELREMLELECFVRPYHLGPLWPRWQPAGELSVVDGLRRCVFATSGTLSLYFTKDMLDPAPKLSLNGLGGEMLSTNYSHAGQLETGEDLRRFFPDRQKYGAGEFIRPEYRGHYERALDDMVDELCELTPHPPDAIDLFYMRVIMRRSFGVGQEFDRSNRLFPLIGAPAVAAGFALGADRRQAQLIPYTVMHRADPRLTTTAFASDRWPHRLAEHIAADALTPELLAAPIAPINRSRPDRPTGPMRAGAAAAAGAAGHKNKTTERRARRQRQLEENLAILATHLVEAPDNPVFEVLDHDAICEAVACYEDLPYVYQQRTFGALTAAMWMGGHEIVAYPDD